MIRHLKHKGLDSRFQLVSQKNEPNGYLGISEVKPDGLTYVDNSVMGREFSLFDSNDIVFMHYDDPGSWTSEGVASSVSTEVASDGEKVISATCTAAGSGDLKLVSPFITKPSFGSKEVLISFAFRLKTNIVRDVQPRVDVLYFDSSDNLIHTSTYLFMSYYAVSEVPFTSPMDYSDWAGGKTWIPLNAWPSVTGETVWGFRKLKLVFYDHGGSNREVGDKVEVKFLAYALDGNVLTQTSTISPIERLNAYNYIEARLDSQTTSTFTMVLPRRSKFVLTPATGGTNITIDVVANTNSNVSCSLYVKMRDPVSTIIWTGIPISWGSKGPPVFDAEAAHVIVLHTPKLGSSSADYPLIGTWDGPYPIVF
jgi:hypothetical protein